MIYHMKLLLDQRLNPLYEAAIEATEEAILNSLCMAREMEGVNGNFAPALPLEEVKDLVLRSALKARPRPSAPPPPKPASLPDEAPRVAEVPPSAARGAEGMMTVPLPKEPGTGS
jgi:D-aminopeptidase